MSEHWLESVPRVTSMSVIVCHLFIATYQVCLTRLQLRSMTSLLLSLSRLARTLVRRPREKVPDGKRKEVMMTYHLPVNRALGNGKSRRSFRKPLARLGNNAVVLRHGQEGSGCFRPYLLSTGVNPLSGIRIRDTTTHL